MPDLSAIRDALKLPADTTDEQVLEAAQARLVEQGNTSDDAPTGDDTTETPETPAPAELPEGMVAIPADTLAALQEHAAQGAEARAQQLDQERDTAIAAAAGDGRIPPANRDAWTTRWNAAPDETRQILAGLPKVLPVGGARGNGHNPVAAAGAVPEDQRARVAAFRGKTPTQKEG